MANYGTSKLVCNVFQKFVELGSKQVLGKPEFPALICGTLFRLSDQIRNKSSSSQVQPLFKPSAPNHAKVCPLLHQWRKLGFSGWSTSLERPSKLGYRAPNGLHFGNTLGRRYYNNVIVRSGGSRNTPETADDGEHASKSHDDTGHDEHTVRKGLVHYAKKLRRIRYGLVFALIGAGVNVLASELETIPYSKRTHFVFGEPVAWEEGEIAKHLEKKHEGRVLAATHPTSKRVASIAKRMIDTLKRDLRDDKVWGGAPCNDATSWKSAFRSRSIEYLEQIEWEVLVVDDPRISNAGCYNGGKIVIFTGLLKLCKCDDEIAFFIGHEIAHVVARHHDEDLTLMMGFPLVVELLLYRVGIPFIRKHLIAYPFYTLPFSRKMELEADYIGLMLMASAGYHPRFAITARETRLKLEERSPFKLPNLLSTHPHGKKRLQLAIQYQEEARAFYRKSRLCTN